MSMNVTNSYAGASTGCFTGAYEKRTAQNECREAAQAYQKESRGTAEDMLGTTVEISDESKSFMAGIKERDTAKQVAMEAAGQIEGGNAFSGTGDLKKQYLVFSENLYNSGFYDNLSDDEVRQMEGLLKDITSGMDSLNRTGFYHDWKNELSHEAAKLEFESSINALNYFADKYVPEEMRGSFKELIKQYESYNGGIVDAHKSIYEMRDESMVALPAPNAVYASQKARESQKEAEAVRESGKTKQANNDKKAGKETYRAQFDRLMQKQDSAANIFNSLQNTLANYTSGGNKNSLAWQMLSARNTSAVNNMKNYWSKLL